MLKHFLLIDLVDEKKTQFSWISIVRLVVLFLSIAFYCIVLYFTLHFCTTYACLLPVNHIWCQPQREILLLIACSSTAQETTL